MPSERIMETMWRLCNNCHYLTRNLKFRRCVDCASSHTYTKRTKNGTPYPHWYGNPYKEGTWVCGKCHKYRQNHGNYPSKEDLADLRNQRLNQRICYECQAKNPGSTCWYLLVSYLASSS